MCTANGILECGFTAFIEWCIYVQCIYSRNSFNPLCVDDQLVLLSPLTLILAWEWNGAGYGKELLHYCMAIDHI